jgi:hypothetical protein
MNEIRSSPKVRLFLPFPIPTVQQLSFAIPAVSHVIFECSIAFAEVHQTLCGSENDVRSHLSEIIVEQS